MVRTNPTATSEQNVLLRTTTRRVASYHFGEFTSLCPHLEGFLLCQNPHVHAGFVEKWVGHNPEDKCAQTYSNGLVPIQNNSYFREKLYYGIRYAVTSTHRYKRRASFTLISPAKAALYSCWASQEAFCTLSPFL